jgi:hypothetical protein
MEVEIMDYGKTRGVELILEKKTSLLVMPAS